MNIGMLWLDDNKDRSIEEKIKRAAQYYQNKYGSPPTICLVNNKMLPEEKEIENIQVQPASNILLHHFWMGRNA